MSLANAVASDTVAQINALKAENAALKQEVNNILSDPDVDAEQAGKYIEAQAAVVFNEIGGYMSEKVLQESFALHLRALGHTVSTGRIVPILFRGENVGFMAMDIMVENVILELKAVDKISETHKGQLAAYLRYSGLKLGFVVNFNSKTNRIDVAQIKIA